MADEAGVEFEEFMTEFDWGDFPGKDDFATGGRVGFESGGDAYQQRAEELALEIFGVADFFTLSDRIQDVLYNRAKKDIDAGNASGGLPRRRYAMGSQGELGDLLVRLRNVVEGSGMYSSFSQQNRKSLQIALTSRINVLLGN